jgi:hypothetical protein
MLDYSLLFVIQFCLGGDQSAQGLCLFLFPGVDRGFPHGVWCSPVFLSIDVQAGLEPVAAVVMVVVVAAVGRNGTKYSQYNVAWEAFHGLGVQDVQSLILVGLYFHLMEEGEEKERKKKKKNCHGKEGFPWGWTCLADCAVGCSC